MKSKLLSMIKRLSARQRHLEKPAMTDPLTGLPNHRALVAVLDQELARYEQHQHVYSVLHLDLDNFKNINDVYGHSIGDAVLKEFAELMRSLLRQPDTVGRWEGDEFLIILPQTSEEEAQAVTERLRAAIAGHSFSKVEGLHLSCSIGIATYPTSGPLPEQTITEADRNMDDAKKRTRQGRRFDW